MEWLVLIETIRLGKAAPLMVLPNQYCPCLLDLGTLFANSVTAPRRLGVILMRVTQSPGAVSSFGLEAGPLGGGNWPP